MKHENVYGCVGSGQSEIRVPYFSRVLDCYPPPGSQFHPCNSGNCLSLIVSFYHAVEIIDLICIWEVYILPNTLVGE